MARNYGRLLLPVVLFVAGTAGQLEAGNCNCKQWMGCGYGPGYNAPAQQSCGQGANGASNWSRGCCEVPANWRLHVWDGYRGDPCNYQKSLVGAQPDVTHMPHGHVYGGPGVFKKNGSCPNCQNGAGAYPYPSMMPAASAASPAMYSQPAAGYNQPVGAYSQPTQLRSGRASSADKMLR